MLMKFCEEDVLSIIISTLHNLPDQAKLQILTALKNLAAHRSLQNKLENAGFILDIVKALKAEEGRELRLACILTLHSICKFSPARQEQAVLAGSVPILLENVKEQGKLQKLSASLLCSFVTASVAARSILRRFNTLEALIGVVELDTSVFDAIAIWVSCEPKQCEEAMCEESNLRVCVRVFSTAGDEVVQCMLKILRASERIVAAVARRGDFLGALYEKLEKCQGDAGKAKNCLDLLMVIANQHGRPRALMDENKFYPLIVKILHCSRDDDLVVLEEIATLLLKLYSGKAKA